MCSVGPYSFNGFTIAIRILELYKGQRPRPTQHANDHALCYLVPDADDEDDDADDDDADDDDAEDDNAASAAEERRQSTSRQ